MTAKTLSGRSKHITYMLYIYTLYIYLGFIGSWQSICLQEINCSFINLLSQLTYSTAHKLDVIDSNVALVTPSSFTNELNLEVSANSKRNTDKLPIVVVASGPFFVPNRRYGNTAMKKVLYSSP